ncbi:hypothetical protein ILUMI_02591 [Ignelater luminosus]|uniref:Reverse transcriptase domain-containing protein n=1 Tax=Ignelater luminosus TaxID=2038154 RepID=A0A8K0GJ52_IGNLU|nr:hypothetical protein ILUMI_02591 [Ignelater luminosus]
MMIRYRGRMDQKMERMKEDPEMMQSVDSLWTVIERTLANVPKKVIGKQERPKMKWMQRRTKSRREEYEDLRGISKNICKKKKRQQLENQIGKIQELHDARKTKYQPGETMIKNPEAKILVNTEDLFTVRPIMKKAWELNTPLYQVFIDFKQAYDSIQRKPLYSEMPEIVIPDKLIRLTRITMEDAKETVEIQLHPSEDFEIKQSLRQRNGLAPLR